MELLLVGIIIGTIGASIVWFFVWRNNKKKFMQTIIDIDSLTDLTYTREELEAELDKAWTQIRSDFIARAENRLNKLK
ncbi:hypothetical protein LCGC14_1282970 [marine sediment metagenome]|uniref:Uncharacterized protein n=1 Tax=marine sediment metagenome TaxID=412755 RepID=A0A0F9KWD8_9ZZZZ